MFGWKTGRNIPLCDTLCEKQTRTRDVVVFLRWENYRAVPVVGVERGGRRESGPSFILFCSSFLRCTDKNDFFLIKRKQKKKKKQRDMKKYGNRGVN